MPPPGARAPRRATAPVSRRVGAWRGVAGCRRAVPEPRGSGRRGVRAARRGCVERPNSPLRKGFHNFLQAVTFLITPARPTGVRQPGPTRPVGRVGPAGRRSAVRGAVPEEQRERDEQPRHDRRLGPDGRLARLARAVRREPRVPGAVRGAPRWRPAWLAALLSGALLATLAGAAPAGAGPARAVADDLDPRTAKAQWIDGRTVAWPKGLGDRADRHRLVYSRTGGLGVSDGQLTGEGEELPLSRVPGGLTEEQRAAHPHLSGYHAYRLAAEDADRVRGALRGQVLAVAGDDAGERLSAATGVQIPGVLDALYAPRATRAALGPVFSGERVTLSVWAPTAVRVAVEVDGEVVPMRRSAASGVWRATGRWKDATYRYHVTVWAPEAQRIVTNRVTDPYSTALTANSRRSVATDLSDPELAPPGWEKLAGPGGKPKAVPARDARIQELHVRDFSANDDTAQHPGTYRAFTQRDSDGTRQLRRLAEAGTSYVHLLPAFDFGTVPERREDQETPDCDLAGEAPDSPAQQECVAGTAGKDAFNWGYDPVHYTVPEGSYATDPEGPTRTREFREMVGGLADSGLRTVMDVVYNHTVASGQDPRSVLDRIVPGYYHRLLEDGSVADSTCCPNTAPEHAMMGKLTVDSVVTWAREYGVDGFRFDLMGHHPKANILAVRAALDELTLEKDGVDGSAVLLYGEGWNFGEVADDARFEQATQRNMAGTGVATFSDRARDAVRGGGPFDEDPRVQGFASGLYTDPNSSPANGSRQEQRDRLRLYQDQVKLGLSGNLADYTFVDHTGRRVRGSEVDYGGQPAGYAADPGDALAYVDAHDNETLYDALAYKLPRATQPADRARAQVLAMATAALSQGPALSHAGSELLRSKSLDRNSYDSGDWFNPLNWDCRKGNGFGRGLPPAADNEAAWPYARPILPSPALRPGCAEIRWADGAYRDLLRLRASEPAFSQPTTEAVRRELSFPLSGPEETPGVITARLGPLVLVFNATPERQDQRVPELDGKRYALHPVQASGSDETVKRSAYDADSGTFSVPARSVAVFTSD
ncbi:pullulanase-type alpha-1,6-glucosidase [Streptomyces sp. AJS327]|nr:pullulanase-type alpha-1,6-glucosidase [Streptomyces sp. AJS327]